MSKDEQTVYAAVQQETPSRILSPRLTDHRSRYVPHPTINDTIPLAVNPLPFDDTHIPLPCHPTSPIDGPPSLLSDFLQPIR